MGIIKQSKLPCPLEDCNSSDAYHIYDDDSGWCYSCNRGTWNRKTPDQLDRKYTNFRGVSKEIQEKLGFISYCDDNDNVLYREYPYGDHSKFREVVPKKFWTTGKIPKLGGKELWNAGSSKIICVVEGEEDAASFMMMSDLPVVWLTSASLGTNRKEIFEYLNPFTKIILAFESDKAGSNAKDIIGTMFPGKVYEASLTKHKDANDYLVNGDEKDFYWAIVNAKRYTADFVYNTEEDFRRILSDEQESFYISTPFEELNKTIRGLPLGKVVLLTGQEGLGKTEILRALEYHTLKEHPDIPLAIIHHEETKKEILDGLSCYLLDKNCKDPDNPVNIEDKLAAINLVNNNGNLHVVDIDDTVDSVQSILEKFNYLVKVCGVKYFFVDPINQFVPADDGSDTTTKFLDGLAQKMGKFVRDNNVCCVWTAHVNDEGQTRNSRMIGKACSIRIDITRNHMSEDEQERNRTKLTVSKNRYCSKTGHAGFVRFNPETFTINDSELPF